jgi:cytochrome c553
MPLDGEPSDLARQRESGLIARSWAFKAGDRKNEMTSIITRDLSPTDSEDLAVYYSPIEISAHKSSGQ